MGVYKTKQLIVIRKDLGMNKGKLAAQAAHASMGALLKFASNDKGNLVLPVNENPDLNAWLTGSFAKIALAVTSEEALKECFEKAKMAGIPCAYIEDNGTTVFHGEKTPTCVGIGPANSDVLDALYGHLSLY